MHHKNLALMESPKELSLSKIRNFHFEIRKMEKEVSGLEHEMETIEKYHGYWPESRLYSAPEEKVKEPAQNKPCMDYIVPWQMV